MVPPGIEPGTQGFSVVHVWYRSVNYARTLITAKREKDELYFIPILYIFIKVKSNKGKKGDGCAKTYWVQPFFSSGCIVEQAE